MKKNLTKQLAANLALPAELQAFVESCLAGGRVNRFCAWDHGESNVWELSDAYGTRYYTVIASCHP